MSSKKAVRRRRADEDIEAAIAYYLNEAGAELATDFADKLEKAIQTISRQASIGSSRYGLVVQLPELRHWQLENFPYLLFYLEKETHIELTRVLHSRMDIPSWLNHID